MTEPALAQPGRSPAAAGSAAPRPGPGRLTRADLARLAQSGRPWEFLAIGTRALAGMPGDGGLRLLVGAAFSRLGLRTAALETVAPLHDDPGLRAEAQRLTTQSQRMPDDCVPVARRRERCERNLEVLARAGPDLRPALAAWLERTGLEQWFLARDGNIVRRDGATGAWIRLVDDVGAVASWTMPPGGRAGGKAGAPAPPMVLEGIDPPWMFRRLSRDLRRESDGYWPRLTVVQRDPLEFLDGLAAADLRAELGASRLDVLVGDDACRRLEALLAERIPYDLGGGMVRCAGLRSAGEPSIEDVLQRAVDAQSAACAVLAEAVGARYAGRDAAWWSRRYEDARAGGGPPLRVLVPTCRFSTFVKHSSDDLCAALRAQGVVAETLVEPDDSSHLTAVAYLRAIERLEPDLVILINYPRALQGQAIPVPVPYVCWIQDAMPHLFDRAVGAAQGPLDFVVGHLYPRLFDTFGYPRERTLDCGIVASERKFSAAPVDRALAERTACDIAYVSHQSEPPERQHERLRDAFARDAGLARVIDRLRPRLEAETLRPHGLESAPGCAETVRRVIGEELGPSAPPELVELITVGYAHPYADRVLRHQTLAWAGAIAERRGWRLALYGRGWDTHPTLARYARPELEHGEELRACYQSAGVHLHMTSHALVHPRLVECVLSGGFPLCRLHGPERCEILTALLGRAGLGDTRAAPDPARSWTDTPGLLAFLAAIQRLELFEPLYPLLEGALRAGTLLELAGGPGAIAAAGRHCAFEALGGHAEFFFHSPETLERRLGYVLERSGARRALVASAAERLRERSTSERWAARILALVREELARQAERGA